MENCKSCALSGEDTKDKTRNMSRRLAGRYERQDSVRIRWGLPGAPIQEEFCLYEKAQAY